MSVFTQSEIDYLTSVTMGRLATIGGDGRPHIAPITFVYNPDEDTLDLGGIDFANTKKWRDVQHNSNVTFLVDDFSPEGAHAVEVRGDAELHRSGGSKIKPALSAVRRAVHSPAASLCRELGPGAGDGHDAFGVQGVRA